MPVLALAYIAPFLGISLLLGPVIAVLAGIYAKHYGLALTTVATVMLVARVFDALTDPLIGYYSDRWRVRTGSRKPFMLVGAILLLPSSYFLLVAPANVSGVYFAGWYMAFYLALTLFLIPYLAWANEFTVTSKDKTLVFSLMAGVGQAGAALFYLIPLLPFFITTDITPEVLKVTVVTGAILLVLGLVVALNVVPDGPKPQQQSVLASSKKRPVRDQAFHALNALISNRPFLLYIGAFMCLGIGVGMWTGLFFIYVDAYLKLGEDFAEISLWGMVGGVMAIPVWYRLSIMFGKRKAWLMGMLLLMAVFIYTSLLRPGASGFSALFSLNMLMTFSLATISVISLPMLCDVIDYGRLNDGVERNASYFSIQALMTKMQVAIGGALGLAIVGWFGFDVHADVQTETSLVGLRLSVSWLPAVFVILAMYFIVRMPLNEKRMEIIRKRLKTRDERAAMLTT